MKMQLTTLHKVLSSALLLSLFLLTSCSSNYVNNRIFDMRDVFSVSCGYDLYHDDCQEEAFKIAPKVEDEAEG